MLVSSEDIQRKYKLDSGTVNFALVHGKCKKYYEDDRYQTLYDLDEAQEAIIGYMCHKAHLAFKEMENWQERAKTLEQTFLNEVKGNDD